MKHTFAFVALLFGSVLASPAPVMKRDPDTVNNLPTDTRNCNGNMYSPADIKTAINFGWQAVQDNKQYWWNHPKGKNTAKYPHRFTPTQMDMQWSDFNLPGCATGPDDGAVTKFQEYPITGSSPWKGGDGDAGKQGNDRVIFQVVDDKTAAFCGIVRHPGKDGVDNHFQMCTDTNTAPIAPYSPGTCSLHLTQWDSMFGVPRYDVEVKIFDNAKKQIGFQKRTGSQGDLTVWVPSALEDDLGVTAESQNDYIAFSLPQQTWPSNGKFGPNDAHNPCSVGDWDCSDYPCYRQMDCSFGCAYHGGESSDNADDPNEG